MRIVFSTTLAALMVMVFEGVASAYVGPGPGITLIGSLFAVIVAVLLAIFSILFWPVKVMLRKMKKGKEAAVESVEATEPGEEKAEAASASNPDA